MLVLIIRSVICGCARNLLPLYPPQRARLPQARCACGGQGDNNLPLYPPQGGGHESTLLDLCRTCRSCSLPDRELNREPSNRSPTCVLHFVPLHQGGRVPLPTSNGTQGVLVFASRTEVRPTTPVDNLQEREEVKRDFSSPCIPLKEGDTEVRSFFPSVRNS
jgi:hypothetical protein